MTTRDWANSQHLTLSSTSSFAPGSPQRDPVRFYTRAGPGFYEPLVKADFARYKRVDASARVLHRTPNSRGTPFRQVSVSSQLRLPSTRYASTASRIDQRGVILGDNSPGPGTYDLSSQFDVRRPVFQPLGAAAGRSSIRDVYPDRRCAIPCKPPRLGSPGPAAYAAVPLMDRLRMTLSSRSTGRPLTVQRARPLTAFVNSSASLTATLSELRH